MLCIALGTVRKHLEHAYEKLDVQNQPRPSQDFTRLSSSFLLPGASAARLREHNAERHEFIRAVQRVALNDEPLRSASPAPGVRRLS
jgi:DNA-binding NarL/FixJ family response regulator